MQEIIDSDTLWKMMDNLSGYPHLPHHLDNCFAVTHTINNPTTTIFNKKITKNRGRKIILMGLDKNVDDIVKIY